MELSYAQSILTGLIQGITELFPISSLGHAVLIPAWVGGDWASFITDPASPYLTVTIALHAASALALFLVFRKRWFSMFGATLKSVRKRDYSTPNTKLFLMLVIATIPVGVLGLTFEEPLQKLFGDPLPSAIFLTLNGLILILVERLTRNNKALVGTQSAFDNIADHITPVSALAVNVVINFDLTRDMNTYLHRIGRSGRWGRKGTAINFVTYYDMRVKQDLDNYYRIQINPLPNNL